MISSNSRVRSEVSTHDPITYQLSTFKPPTEAYLGPPVVTACAWAIHDGNTGDLLWSKQEEERREMASLTKMMTCLVSCNLVKSLELDLKNTIFSITRAAGWITGTHSGLKEGDKVSIENLLYGMMLPSGNDCALSLANSLGNMLLKKYNKRHEDTNCLEDNVKAFVKEMNKTATKLSLRNTSFANPHGLSEKGNKSTAADLGRLAVSCMGNPTIAVIVNTKEYTAVVSDFRGNKKELIWTNTNKLLDQGFCGVKTGNTPNAGPCLSLCITADGDPLFITLLGSKTSDHRWQEAVKLANWFIGKMKVVRSEMELRAKTSAMKFRPRIIAGICKQI